MIKAILVDDEQHCLDRLKMLLQYFEDSIEIVALTNNLKDARREIASKKPHVVFLDIKVHNENGFDLLRQLPTIDFEVIFTTAFDNYAIEAFKFSAVDYLLKPITREDLARAVDKLKEKKSSAELSNKIDVLLHNLNDTRNGGSKKIAVPTVQGLSFVLISEIVRCQSDANYTHLYLSDNRKITAAKNLKYFETILEPHNFFRTHHSHLINIELVDKYIKGKGGYLLMMDGSSVEVAVRRKDEFLKRIM